MEDNFIIDPLSFPSTKQIFDTTGNANFTPSQLSSLMFYIFKAIINGTSESETTDEIRLDFTGPTVP